MNVAVMDFDDPARPPPLCTLLGREDLDPLSVAELESRIITLQAEIVRTKTIMERAVNHRAIAETLFKS